jgi:hypothetical protein
MARESAISNWLETDPDIHALKLNIQAEKKYLEDIQSKLHSDAQKYKIAKEQLPEVDMLLKKHFAKAHKAPALIKNERWMRPVSSLYATKRKCIDFLQGYDRILADQTKHENILRSLKNEYTERVISYIMQSDDIAELNTAHIFSPEEISQAKETFLNCTFPSPRMSK